jgi:hypothetical protein
MIKITRKRVFIVAISVALLSIIATEFVKKSIRIHHVGAGSVWHHNTKITGIDDLDEAIIQFTSDERDEVFNYFFHDSAVSPHMGLFFYRIYFTYNGCKVDRDRALLVLRKNDEWYNWFGIPEWHKYVVLSDGSPKEVSKYTHYNRRFGSNKPSVLIFANSIAIDKSDMIDVEHQLASFYLGLIDNSCNKVNRHLELNWLLIGVQLSLGLIVLFCTLVTGARSLMRKNQGSNPGQENQ